MTAPDTHASVNQLAWLGDVRAALLRLHKTLLDSEKLRYEKTHGRINGGLAFLQLAANDPWFAWIRPIGSLIVEIDERQRPDATSRQTLRRADDPAAGSTRVVIQNSLRSAQPHSLNPHT